MLNSTSKFNVWLLIFIFSTLLSSTQVLALNTMLGDYKSYEQKPKRLGYLKLDPILDQEKRLTRAEVSGFVSDGNSNLIVGALDNHWLAAIHLDTKKLAWIYEVKEPIHSKLEVHNKVLYFSTIDGVFTAINLEQGNKKWEIRLDSFISRPIHFSTNNAFLVTASQQLYNIDLAAGNTLWNYDTNSSGLLFLQSGAAPILVGENVFLGLISGEIEAINVLSGKAQWRYNPEFIESRFHDVTGELLVSDQRVVMTRYDGLVSCFEYSQRDRNLVWKDSIASISASTGRSGWYFVGTVLGDVYAYEISSGKRIWKASVGQSVQNIITGERNLYVSGSQGRVASLDLKTGNIHWMDDLSSRTLAHPMLSQNYLAFLTGQRALYFYGL